MIRAKQGRADDARKLLDGVARALEAREQEPWGDEWINRVHCREVLREAKMTVAGP
jgi:hypothetical protein